MVSRHKIVPVILAGGTGTRLWPLSRQSLPKQFIALVSENTLYQDTLLRVAESDVFLPPSSSPGPTSASSPSGRLPRSKSIRPSCWSPCAGTAAPRSSRPPLMCATSTAPRHWCWPSPPTSGVQSRRLPRLREQRRRSASKGSYRHVRHPSAGPQHRLWLHQAGHRGGGHRCGARGPLRGKAGRRDRGPLCGRWLSLELRQLPLPRRPDAGGRGAARARNDRARGAAIAKAKPDLTFLNLDSAEFSASKAISSISRCWNTRRPRRWWPATSAGPTSAPGTRSMT